MKPKPPPLTRSSNQRPWMIVYALVLTALCSPRILSPEWNFDSVAYVAVAKESPTESIESLHQSAYDTVEAVAEPSAFRRMTRGSRYRKQLRENADRFETQLPFYRSKIAYIAAVQGLDAIGVNAATATHLVSAASIISLGVLALLWTGANGIGLGLCGAALCLMMMAPFRLAVGFSNPDPLCAALLCWGLYAMRTLRRPIVGTVLMTLAVLTRADAWIMVTLLLVWLHASTPQRITRKVAIGAWLATLSGVLTVMAVTAPYGWGVVAKHTFVDKLYRPEEMDQTIALGEYIDALWSGALGEHHLYPTAIASFLLITALVIRSHGRQWLNAPQIQLIAVAWVGAILHFFLFPSLNDRFYLVTYFIVGVEGIAVLWNQSSEA